MASGALSQHGEKLLLYYSLGLSLSGFDTPNTTTGLWAGLIIETTNMDNQETGSTPTYNEPTSAQYGATYARVQLGVSLSTDWEIFDDQLPTRATYKKDITFPTLGNTATGATIRYVGLYTAQTGGKLVWFTDLKQNKTLAAQETPIIRGGTVTFLLD